MDHVVCPIDRSHIIRKSRFAYHLTRCKRSHPNVRLEYCFYNSSHVGGEGFAAAHEPTCGDKDRFDLTAHPLTPFPRHNVVGAWGGVGNVEHEWNTEPEWSTEPEWGTQPEWGTVANIEPEWGTTGNVEPDWGTVDNVALDSTVVNVEWGSIDNPTEMVQQDVKTKDSDRTHAHTHTSLERVGFHII